MDKLTILAQTVEAESLPLFNMLLFAPGSMYQDPLAASLLSTQPGGKIPLQVFIAAFLFLWWLWNWLSKGQGTVTVVDGEVLLTSEHEAFPTLMEMDLDALNDWEACEIFQEKSGAISHVRKSGRKVELTYSNQETELYSFRSISNNYTFSQIN